MSSNLKELKKQARALSVEDKAALARMLIEELDTYADPDADQLWVEEAQRRYDAFAAGELKARPGEEVMKQVRKRLQARQRIVI